jgi:hypothetical protein
VVRAAPDPAHVGEAVAIIVDSSERLQGDTLDSLDVLDSAGQPIPLDADVDHPWNTRWVYYTAALPDTTAEGPAAISVAGTDTRGNPGTAQATFDVIVNRPPVADAGPDQTVEQTDPAGAAVTLDGTGSSDPEGDPLDYAWDIDGDGQFDDATGATPQVLLQLGTHHMTLKVTDPGDLSDTDTVIISVVDTVSPVVAITSPQDGASYPYGAAIEFEFSAADSGSGVATVTGALEDGSPVASGTSRSDLSLNGHTLTVSATDHAGNTDTESVTFTIVNTPGTVTAGGWIELADKKGTCGFEVRYTAGDPGPSGNVQYTDHDTKMSVNATAILGLGIWGNTAAFHGTCTIDGNPGHSFRIDVVDNGEPGNTDQFRIHLDTGYDAGGVLGGGNITIH